MLAYPADENFDGNIVRALRRRLPELSIVRVQDVGLSGRNDPTILEWAAERDLLILTHDVATFPMHAAKRVERGEPMPGLVAVLRSHSRQLIIDDLLLIAQCSHEREWEGQVLFVPLHYSA